MNFVKNHWKKLTFASCCAAYGTHYAWWHYELSKHMRNVCEETLVHTQKLTGPPKRVLVVLNPVAKDKKTEKMFKKYSEPLLHLAGYSVDILKTKEVGHAKTVIEELTTMPDAIVIAGGDGTSSEVVTGLLRRQHSETCPIVFLPLGNKNETAFKFIGKIPETSLEYMKSLSSALLPMVYDQSRPKSVIRYDVLKNTGEEGEPSSKEIYGLTRFSWGLLREIEAIKDKYWYFGPLRHNAAALFNAFSKNLNWRFEAEVEYTPPCEGCSNCVVIKKSKTKKSFLMGFVREQVSPQSLAASRVNPDCKQLTQDHIVANQLNVMCTGSALEGAELKTEYINSLAPGMDFVKNVLNVTRNNIMPAFVLKSRTITLKPEIEESSEQFFTIDGEEYDIRPIRLSLIPNAINVYC